MNPVWQIRKCNKRAEEEVSQDIIIEILNRLPSKSLARFNCVSKSWQKYIADCRCQRWKLKPYLVGFFYQAPAILDLPSQISFFFSSKEGIDGSFDESLVNLPGKRARIVASSNGFLLFNMHTVYYYVYNPATRQRLALPKTQILMENNPAVGFFCKVDNPDKDIISFTIVRYAIPPYWDLTSSVTVESFSSETNVWTANNIILDVPLALLHSTYMKSPSASVIDGVFFWLDDAPKITVYDSINECFWALNLPEGIRTQIGSCFLGSSGEALYFAFNFLLKATIIVFYLASNIRSRDAVWVKKYVGNVSSKIQQCPEAFQLKGSRGIEVMNMAIHPAVPHIFYLDVLGRVISYDFEADVAELVYDFRDRRRRHPYKLFPYEWHQWPRLL